MPTKLILLHGGPGMDCSYFFPFFESLTAKCCIISYTQGSSGAKTLSELTQELGKIVCHLNYEKVYLFAHSFGGLLALDYLQKNETLITGIILCSWIYDADWLDAYYSKNQNELIDDKFFLESDQQYKKQTIDYVYKYFLPHNQALGRRVLSKITYNSYLRNLLLKKGYTPYDYKSIIRKLAKPTMSITGLNDEVVFVEYIRKAVNLNKKIFSVELPEAGHFPFIEQQSVFMEKLENFISQV